MLAYLKGQVASEGAAEDFPQTLVERIHWKAPLPDPTPPLWSADHGRYAGWRSRRIAEARALDVISLGIDQDAQENFFHPERQDPRRHGAGGVPVRSGSGLPRALRGQPGGNFPLLRTYSGTDDFIRLAEMYVETINIAWCAIPLFWFNQMDGRGPWDLEGSIREHQQVMAWYGERGIPVELNEPHHWGMRDAPDVVFVVSAYLSAYNARAFGVQDYIAQLMFNSPPGLSDAMDLAKMLAVLDLIEPLAGADFRIWRQTRTGLLSYPLDLQPHGQQRNSLPSVVDGVIRMTVLRSPCISLAAQDIASAREAGSHVFEAVVSSGAGELQAVNPVRLGREFNAPFIAVSAGANAASKPSLPPSQSFLKHENPVMAPPRWWRAGGRG